MAKKDITQFQRTRRYKAGVAAINAADNAAKIKAALVAHGKKLDLDMVAYGQLSVDGQGIIDSAVLAGKGTGYKDRDALALVFVPALFWEVGVEFALGLINAALSAERMAQLAEKYGEAWGMELDDYDRLSAANKLVVCGEILGGQPYTDVDVVLQALESAVEDALEEQALEAINDVSNDTPEELAKMDGVLEDYWDVFEIEEVKMDAYRGLDDLTGKPEIHAALQGKTYKVVSAVKTGFDTAVDAQVAAEETAVTAINEASTEGDMGTALGAHKAILGIAESIDSGDYHDLSDKTGVHNALIALQDFEAIAEIRDAFNDAVGEAKAAEGGIAT